jgi:aspartate racemase
LGGLLANAAQRLERSGADVVVLCTNTMHDLADCVAGAVQIPLPMGDSQGDVRSTKVYAVAAVEFAIALLVYQVRFQQRQNIAGARPDSESVLRTDG